MQPPAPSHPIARGRAGPVLLAEIAFGKFCLHLPLHRQSRSFSHEGVEIDVSTMADWMGAVSVALKPMVDIIEAYVLGAQRLHVDDTPVPVLAKGKTKTGRLWTAVRDDRPFGGTDPPAAFYVYSPDRGGVHPEAFLRTWSGIMQADAYAGFNRLYEPARLPGTIVEAGCSPASPTTRSRISPPCCLGIGHGTRRVVNWRHDRRHRRPSQNHAG